MIKDIKIDVVGEKGDDEAHALFKTLMQATSTVTSAAINLTDSSATAVYASLGAALGSLQVAGAILSRREENNQMPENAINQDTVTLACCLILVCASIGDNKSKGHEITKFEFGARKYKEALTMFHTVTGRDADEKFASNFVKAAHEAISHLN